MKNLENKASTESSTMLTPIIEAPLNWSADSWQNYTVKQIPKYENHQMNQVQQQLKEQESLVSLQSIQLLKDKLQNINDSNSFIVQMGECAETFSQSTKEDISSRVDFFHKVESLFNHHNIIKIGRIAGQYAKPRSETFENIDGKEHMVYKGDMLNNFEHSKSRDIDVTKLLQAYQCSKDSIYYLKQADPSIFTSHEGLILPYESALTKQLNNQYFASSAHMLWLGERTRFINSAHIEYLRGIINPIGIKVSHNVAFDELTNIIKLLNPKNEGGKIILIHRFGVKHIKQYLPILLLNLKKTSHKVIHMLDVMHGNTMNINNIKTRNMSDMTNELQFFNFIIKDNHLKWGGIHLENTYEDVTECIDSEITTNKLQHNYKTYCDPRMNHRQTLFFIKNLVQLL